MVGRYATAAVVACVLCVAAAVPAPTPDGAQAAPTRVLFIGNSFTFVNDLPHQLVNIAESLGHDVEVANSTIGGCTAYYQATDERTTMLLQQEWDYIVLQSYSILPTVQKARATYLTPAVKAFAAKKKQAKIVMYLTWGYRSGNDVACPSSGPPKCFPRGTNANLTQPPCDSSDEYHAKVGTFECMGYALGRAYLAELGDGADMVAPCGLAWQVVRGAAPTPRGCQAAIDREYTTPSPFSAAGNLTLPLHVDGLPAALSKLELYRWLGTKWDKHPNMAGQYLNALVFFATLTGTSPVGAAGPLQTGKAPALPLAPSLLAGLQHAAASVVLDHAAAWHVTPKPLQ